MKKTTKAFLLLLAIVTLTGCRTRYITQEVEVERQVVRHDTSTVVKFATVVRHDTVREAVREAASVITLQYDTAGRIMSRQTAKYSRGAEKSSRGGEEQAATEAGKRGSSSGVEYRYKDRGVEKSKPWHEAALERVGTVSLVAIAAWLCLIGWRICRRRKA